MKALLDTRSFLPLHTVLIEGLIRDRHVRDFQLAMLNAVRLSNRTVRSNLLRLEEKCCLKKKKGHLVCSFLTRLE